MGGRGIEINKEFWDLRAIINGEPLTFEFK